MNEYYYEIWEQHLNIFKEVVSFTVHDTGIQVADSGTEAYNQIVKKYQCTKEIIYHILNFRKV